MIEINPALKRITSIMSKATYRLQLHCTLYFALLFICQAQIIACLVPENTALFVIFKWFDCSNYIQPATFLYFISTICFLLAATLFLWMIQLRNTLEIETNPFFHNLIKISVTSAYIVTYLFMLPLIKCTSSLVSVSDNNLKILSVFTLIIFFAFLYPISTFFIAELSPCDNKTVAYLNFPNCFTFLNLFRIILFTLVALGKANYVIISTIVFFLTLIVLLTRSPVISWKYNKMNQIFFTFLKWNIIWSTIQMINQIEASMYIYLIGGTAFVFCMNWILQKRTVSIITNEKGSKIKLRLLYFLIANLWSYEEMMAAFLFKHYKNCQSLDCHCHKLLEFYRNYKPINKPDSGNDSPKLKGDKSVLKTTFSSILKLKQSKLAGRKHQFRSTDKNAYDQEKQKRTQQNLWLQFLFQLQNEHINTESIIGLPSEQKQKHLTEARQILLDQAQILHHNLDRHYQSLRYTQMVHQSKFNVVSLLFLVRLFIEMHRQEKIIEHKVKGEGCNIYALNYYELQQKLTKFQQVILKLWNKTHSFFVELTCDRPNQTKIVQFLIDMIRSKKQLHRECFKYSKLQDNPGKPSNSYESIWNKKVCKAMHEFYEPFANLMGLKSMTIPKMGQDVQENKVLQKDLKFYSSTSKTGVCVASVQDGAQFGKISNTNKQFWDILDTSRYTGAYINDFLVQEMRDYHTGLMRSFLNKNTCFINFSTGFLTTNKKEIIEVQFSLHMLPIINDQLQFAFFMQSTPSTQPILLVNQMSNIISINAQFQNRFLLERNSLEDFNKELTKQIIDQAMVNNNIQIVVNEQEYLMTLCRAIKLKNNESLSYFFIQKVEGESILESHRNKEQKDDQLQPCVNVISPASKQPGQKLKREQKRQQLIRQSKIKIFLSFLKSLTFEEKNFKLRLWKVFSYVILFCIIVFCLTCAGLSQFRVNLYSSAHRTLQNLSNFAQQTTEVPNLARKINIQSYNNGNSTLVAERIVRMEALGRHMVQNRQFSTDDWWQKQADSFQLGRDGRNVKQFLTFQMIMSKCLFSGISTYTGNKLYEFDYVLSNNSLPLSNQIIVMYAIIYNTFYIILPEILSQMREAIIISQGEIIKNPVPIIPIILSMIFLCLVLQIVTIFLKIKLINLFHEAFSSLKKLKLAQVQQKIDNLNLYKDAWLKDITLSKIQKNPSLVSPIVQHQNRYVSQLDSQIGDGQGDETPKQIIYTARTEQSSRAQSRICPTLPRHKIKLEVNAPDKIIPTLKIILQLILIIISALILFVVQFTENKNVWNSVMLSNLYNQKIENLKIINSYSYQMGYEKPQFKNQSFSLLIQMPKILQKAYEIERNIEQSQAIVGTDYVNEMRVINTMTMCQSLQLAADQFQVEPCTQQQIDFYGSKTRKQILTQFVQSTRSFCSNFEKLSLTVDDQRSFATDQRHVKLYKQQQKLINIQTYVSKQFEKRLQTHVSTYQIKIVLTCVVLTVVIILLGLSWVPWHFKQFERELDKIKLTYQLLVLISGTEDDGSIGTILQNLSKLEPFY